MAHLAIILFIRPIAWHAYPRDVSRCRLADQRSQSRSRSCVEKMVRLALFSQNLSSLVVRRYEILWLNLEPLSCYNGVLKRLGKNVLFWIICRTLKANSVHQDLPPISRCHSYTINAKYTYRCTNHKCANTWVFGINLFKAELQVKAVFNLTSLNTAFLPISQSRFNQR